VGLAQYRGVAIDIGFQRELPAIAAGHVAEEKTIDLVAQACVRLGRTHKRHVRVEGHIYPGAVGGLAALVAVLDVHGVVKASAQQGHGDIDGHQRAFGGGNSGKIEGVSGEKTVHGDRLCAVANAPPDGVGHGEFYLVSASIHKKSITAFRIGQGVIVEFTGRFYGPVFQGRLGVGRGTISVGVEPGVTGDVGALRHRMDRFKTADIGIDIQVLFRINVNVVGCVTKTRNAGRFGEGLPTQAAVGRKKELIVSVAAQQVAIVGDTD
jgi:hypothetical protein